MTKSETALAWKILRRAFPNLAKTPEVLQAALIGVWKARQSKGFVETKGKFVHYASYYVRNEVHSYFRESRLLATSKDGLEKVPVPDSLDTPIDEDDPDRTMHDLLASELESAEEALARHELHDLLHSTVAELREPDKEVVQLWLRGDSTEEIAIAMGLTRQRVSQIFTRAKQTLAKRLVDV